MNVINYISCKNLRKYEHDLIINFPLSLRMIERLSSFEEKLFIYLYLKMAKCLRVLLIFFCYQISSSSSSLSDSWSSQYCANVKLFDYPFKHTQSNAYSILPLEKLTLNHLNALNLTQSCKQLMAHFYTCYKRQQKWTFKCE